ncbi:MAG: NfeD family protein [Nocardioidaceae bacterium]
MAIPILLGMGAIAPAYAQEAPNDDAPAGVVEVVEVSGWLDTVLVDFVEDSIADAEDAESVAIVLQLDSPGAVVGARRMDRLVQRIDTATVTVAAWVGPSGARAGRDAARLVEAADIAGLAPGSTLDTGSGRVGSGEAARRGLTELSGREAATVGDFIVNLPGVESREIRDGDEIRREPITRARFSQLPLLDQLMHTVASPPVAYLLFVAGLTLLLFELFTAGVGVAGVVGAGAFLFGCYGLAALPVSPVGVGLLLVAMFGFAVDIQTGVPRLWTGIGTVAFVLGSLLLYEDPVALSWITLLIAVVAIVLVMLAGMPAMVRSRFSTPTIGRDWMLGETGVARTAVDPEGVVVVGEAPWRARTNRATPIAAGDAVRVAAIEGLLLEVEPLDGAARDHRDRSKRPEHDSNGRDTGNSPSPD